MKKKKKKPSRRSGCDVLPHVGLRGDNRAVLQRSAITSTRKKGYLRCDSRPLEKKSVKNIFTPVLQFSAKIVNYCADEFHSFVKENWFSESAHEPPAVCPSSGDSAGVSGGDAVIWDGSPAHTTASWGLIPAAPAPAPSRVSQQGAGPAGGRHPALPGASALGPAPTPGLPPQRSHPSL